MTEIYVDSDGCPVKQEVVRVAKRHGLGVTFVSGSWMRLPEEWGAKLVVAGKKFDAADDWIAGHAAKYDVVVTADVPLATRDLLHVLRGAGEITGGPAPFQKEDRSRFLQVLDQAIQDIKKSRINRSLFG